MKTMKEPDEAMSGWNGGQRRDFLLNGRLATLVAPGKPREGSPWIWRTEFFGAFPSVDVALLDLGYHVAYLDIQNLYGAPVAITAMEGFYSYLLEKHHLSRRPVLEGFSRGGLFALNWAAKHPDRVGALYLDAPVCDFKSWPAGMGKGKGAQGDWERCKMAYGLNEEEALRFPLNPVDNLHPIAKAGLSIIAVAGDSDDIVPMEENIGVVETRFREMGGNIKLILKKGVGHHPHSLEDPAPVVEFLERNALR